MSHSHLFEQANASLAPIMIVDRSLIVRFANQAARQLISDHEADFQSLLPEMANQEILGQCLDFLADPSPVDQSDDGTVNTLPYQTDLRVGARIFSLLIGPQLNSDGEYVAQSIQWQDVTEARKHDNIDTDFRDQWEAINRSQMVIQFSVDAYVLSANDQFLKTMGYELDDVVGKHHSMFVDSIEQNEVSYREHWARLRKGEFVAAEFRRVANHKREIWIRASYHPIRGRNGKIQKVVEYAYDITELKRIEGELELAQSRCHRATKQVESLNRELAQQIDIAQQLALRADEAHVSKSEFLANMSHEIRTPMTAILGYTDILLDTDLDDDIRDAAVIVKRNGEHLIELINDILDLSKLDSGKIRLEHYPVSPRRIVEEVHSMMHVRAAAKALPLEFGFEGPIPVTIQTDPTRLRQILVNVVGNGIKFTETGSVNVVTQLIDPAAERPLMSFEVSDTGIGIAEDRIETLFSPFTQDDNSTTREFGGTGLGLTISKRMVEALGGRIEVTSTKGVGSTFTVLVPTGSLAGVEMTQGEEKRSPTHGTQREVPSEANNLSGARILLAEDGPDNQRLIAFLLRKAGADVEVADNGKIALDLALEKAESDEAYDLILMDMQMPEMDGYEATRRLRAKKFSCPIIAVTAHAMRNDREKCLSAGCDDYLTKPVDRDQMIGTVVNYTKRGRNRVP